LLKTYLDYFAFTWALSLVIQVTAEDSEHVKAEDCVKTRPVAVSLGGRHEDCWTESHPSDLSLQLAISRSRETYMSAKGRVCVRYPLFAIVDLASSQLRVGKMIGVTTFEETIASIVLKMTNKLGSDNRFAGWVLANAPCMYLHVHLIIIIELYVVIVATAQLVGDESDEDDALKEPGRHVEEDMCSHSLFYDHRVAYSS
jgi:hypothetical protein